MEYLRAVDNVSLNPSVLLDTHCQSCIRTGKYIALETFCLQCHR